MCKRRRSPFLPLFFLAIAILSLLSLGAIKSRYDFETRGIPDTLPEPISNSEARLGINVQLEQYDEGNLLNVLSRIESSGFEAIKQSFYFEEEFNWQNSDRLVSAVDQLDLDLVPVLDGNPKDNFAAVNPQQFAAWASEFAKRYGDQIRYYIIWDEPNLTEHWGNQPVNAAEYAAILSSAAEAIRKTDPDAVIVGAPLAPTVEEGPKNLADHLYLQALYEAGAASEFDVVASKPYGFDSGPMDRTVDPNILNFSRIILLREVMEDNDDANKPIWAGNWGWNSLPEGWQGQPSIWGQVDKNTQAAWTVSAIKRAREEWPWMGTMFLENWEPAAGKDDPRWGFSIANDELLNDLRSLQSEIRVAYPGFYQAKDEHPTQAYSGNWRFSPEFGADVGQSGDEVYFDFWGTDLGLRVRRSNYRGRFYIDVDGKPANNLPRDESGATLVLSSPNPAEDYISTEQVARNLAPGEHTASVKALRGTEQWALNGFSVGYRPPLHSYYLGLGVLASTAVVALIMFYCSGRNANWGEFGQRLSTRFNRFSEGGQLFLTALSAALVAVAGWLTWGEQAVGIYRRLGDGGQLALTAAAASIFYISPSFVLYLTALAILFVLIFLRPAWGLAIVAATIPFHVKPKAILGYRFSPVEIFLLVTVLAYVLRAILIRNGNRQAIKEGWSLSHLNLVQADWAVLILTTVATLSLLFTERLDVATNEWRVVILEPALFYFLVRAIPLKEKEVWVIFDAFVLGGLLVAFIGLWQYVTGQNLITSEGGLMRLRSIYGSPNNVALYLGRIIPILGAMALMGQGRRKTIYGLALIPIGLATLLTFSKGAFFLGLPASLLVVIILWRRSLGGRVWPWVFGAVLAGSIALFITFQIPQLAGRLDFRGETGIFRINLWRSSINMFLDHPIFGVGLDNFLYQYRGRYIFDAAWQEPNLNHPHNILLDFATRLGILGLIAGVFLFWTLFQLTRKLPSQVASEWRPVAIGLLGSFIYMIAHGLVDHSFFLIDLAYTFYLFLGISVWLRKNSAI